MDGGGNLRVRGRHRFPQFAEQGAPLLLDSVREVNQMQEAYTAVCLEVGCGRGGFLREMAAKFPSVLFVGVDYVPFVVAQAAAQTVATHLQNVRFFVGDVHEVGEQFTPHCMDAVFLNFSDPWPRRRQSSRRLTDIHKLKLYQRLLKSDGVLEFKTDNRTFFDWSVRSIRSAGWTLQEVDTDVSATPPSGETVIAKYTKTEYELRFRRLAIPIAYLRATPPPYPAGNATGSLE